jgi:hypothetical protein
MLLVSDTRPLQDLANTIVAPRPMDISPGGAEGHGSSPSDAVGPRPMDISPGGGECHGISRSDASGEDFSMVCDDDDDPFLDFAHS